MAGTFRVLSLPVFEKEFRKKCKSEPGLEMALSKLVEILSEDPHNRSGKYDIKN